MTVKMNDAAKRCDIWVEHGARSTYQQSEAYRQTVRHARAKGYRVCVFLGGEAPLLPGVTALLEHQHPGVF